MNVTAYSTPSVGTAHANQAAPCVLRNSTMVGRTSGYRFESEARPEASRRRKDRGGEASSTPGREGTEDISGTCP